MKKLFSISLLTLSILLLSSIVLADSKHVYSGGYPASVVDDLRYVLSGGDSSYQQDIMKAGANEWNGLSTNVNVSLNSSDSRMSIYKSSTSVDGLFGECVPYTSDYEEASTSDVWYVTDIYIYDNQLDNYGATDDDKKATVSHEVGHGLSMGHTNDLSTAEVMDQGFDKALTPTSIDEDHLELKWGY